MTIFCAPVNSENFKIMQKMCTVSRSMESCVSIFQPISIRPAAICVPVHRIWRFYRLSQGEKYYPKLDTVLYIRVLKLCWSLWAAYSHKLHNCKAWLMCRFLKMDAKYCINIFSCLCQFLYWSMEDLCCVTLMLHVYVLTPCLTSYDTPGIHVLLWFMHSEIQTSL